MASSSKKRQTIAKFTRERAVQEKRARKHDKKQEKKLAAAAARDGETSEAANAARSTGPGPTPDGEMPAD